MVARLPFWEAVPLFSNNAMKKLLLILLFGFSLAAGCEQGLPLPPKPDKEQEKEEDKKDEEQNKGEEGKWDDEQTTVVNGTVISDATTLYGVVRDKQSGLGIEGVVVSDGFSCVKTDKNGVYQIIRDKNATVVYVTVPAEYEIPVDNGNHATFYKRFSVAASEKFTHDFTLELLPGGKQTQFTLLTLADIQVHDTNDVERFRDETVPDIDNLVPTLVNPYAITLGDITNKNNSAMWTKIRQTITSRKVKYLHCMGNHDHLNELSPNDHSNTTSYWKSVENFQKYFGPQNYSFDRGDVHFVVIDNCLHGEKPDNAGGTHEYATGLYEWGYKWFLQDLSFVPKSKMVVLCAHIPFRNGSGDNHNNGRYRKEILNKLSEYREAHILIGHTHHAVKYIHTINGKRIEEHIHGAVCGQMWHGPIGRDGTPNGYGVFEFDGNTVKDHWFKGTGFDKEFQIRCYKGGEDIYDPRMNVNMTAKKNIFPSYNWGLKDHIVANIWDIELGEWDVTLWQNGKKVCNMTAFTDYDYYALYWFCEIYGSASDSYQQKTSHIYYGKLADPNAPFEVRAEDKRGLRGPYVCSEITTNYDGLNGDFATHIPDL